MTAVIKQETTAKGTVCKLSVDKYGEFTVMAYKAKEDAVIYNSDILYKRTSRIEKKAHDTYKWLVKQITKWDAE